MMVYSRDSSYRVDSRADVLNVVCEKISDRLRLVWTEDSIQSNGNNEFRHGTTISALNNKGETFVGRHLWNAKDLLCGPDLARICIPLQCNFGLG